MPKSVLPLFAGWVVVVASSAHADEIYVAPGGDDAAAGTEQAPFATVERAQMAAEPGDTVWIRGGVYAFSGSTRAIGVSFTKSGVPESPIRYFAYPNETPTFDLFELKPQERVTGLDVRCDWIHVRGLEVRGVRQIVVGDSWGVRIRGDHNIVEQLHVHDNEAPGIFITSGADNLVLNSDSHHNYDPLEDGDNADGFGCHSTGQGNVLRGCRAWDNSDDGFDFINAAGACTVEHSWAFRNGFIPDTDTFAPNGNGAGFKSGGYGYPPQTPASGAAQHVVRFNVAFGNRVVGFYANFHPGGIDFINNTAFDNPANFDMRTPGTPSSHTLRNNLAAGSGMAIINFDRSTGGTDEFNSWTLPVVVTAEDFESLDHAEIYADRLADGSLPPLRLARLREDSDLIDQGQDRGFPFSGAAPDLGAFESGLSSEPQPDSGLPQGDEDPAEPTAGRGGAQGSAGNPGQGDVSGATGDKSSTRAASGHGPGQSMTMLPAGSTRTAQPETERQAGTGGTVAARGMTQSPGTAAESNAEPDAYEPSGCSCRVVGVGERGWRPWPIWSGPLAWGWWRRRRARPTKSRLFFLEE